MPKNKVAIIDLFENLEDHRLTTITEKDEAGNIVPFADRSVLGVFQGVFFVPDGISRNQRFYSREFWEAVLKQPEVQRRLKELLMYGAIGHKETPVSDDDLNEGKVSHIVVELYIDEKGRGIGKAIILNTEAGRNLYKYLSLEYNGKRSKLRISSRAAGGYKDTETHDGIPDVDEDNYFLDTFDIVKEPGFLETDLSLVNSKNPNVDENLLENRSEEDMCFTPAQLKAVSNIVAEAMKNTPGATVPENGNATILENANLKNENKRLLEKLDNQAETSKFLESIDPDSLIILKKLVTEGKSNYVKLWNDIDTPENIDETGAKVEAQMELLEQYLAIDTPANIKKLIKTANEKADLLKKYESIDTPENIESLIEKVETIQPKLEQIGDLDAAVQVVEAVNNKLPKLLKTYEDATKAQINKKAIEIAEKYSQEVKDVREQLVKFGERKTIQHYAKLAESKPSNNNNNQETRNEKNGNKPNVNESSTKQLLSSINDTTVNEGVPEKLWGSMARGSKFK